MTLKQIDTFINNYILGIVIIAVISAFIVLSLDKIKARKKKKLRELKKGTLKKAHGIIFGKKGRKLVYSPENAEGHVLVCAATGQGKTSSIGIPTLRSWQGTSYTIDISGDICKNCPDMPQKLIYDPESHETVPYNIFGAIDSLKTLNDKNEALEKLAFLLMPEAPNMNDNAKFFLVNGRKILTASLIAFYGIGMDFIQICEKIVSSNYKDLFTAIDETKNEAGKIYINSFVGTSEQNTSGCFQSCCDSIILFATNEKIKNSIRRPENGEKAIEPKKLEHNNIFVVVREDKLALYAPLMNIITSQMMQYITTRKTDDKSPTILLILDEYSSLKLDGELVKGAVQRFRKRKCRLMLLMQNIVDMEVLYGKELTRAILSNLHFKVLLGGLGEPESQKYFAELIGYKNATRRSISKSGNKTTQTKNETKEYVIEPAELDRQGKDTVILIHPENAGYMFLKKNYYFKN